MREFGDDTDVRGATPFTVGQDIDAGVFLQSDGISNRSVELAPGISLAKQRTDGVRTRQGAND